MNDTTRDELIENAARSIEFVLEAYGQLRKPVSREIVEAQARHTATRMVAEISAARDAEIRKALLEAADGYIVAKGQDGEAEAAFATKPWMEQILAAIGLHGDETGGQG